jgi:hypothetical protein
MSVKTRVNKLYDRYHQDWVAVWDSFYINLFNLLPDEAIERLASENAFLASENAYNLQIQDAREIISRLFNQLGLDEALWEAWAKQVATLPDLDNPKPQDYLITPQSLPKAPESHWDAWQIILTWKYPDTLEGYIKATFVYYLAIAFRLEAG